MSENKRGEVVQQTSSLCVRYIWSQYLTIETHSTVDRENFAVKIISRSRPTAKIKHAKNKLRGDAQ